jgi:hypothetical protein
MPKKQETWLISAYTGKEKNYSKKVENNIFCYYKEIQDLTFRIACK